jgi:hypothetical protein
MKKALKLILILICITIAISAAACTPSVQPQRPAPDDDSTVGGGSLPDDNKPTPKPDPDPNPNPDPDPDPEPDPEPEPDVPYEDTTVAVLDRNNPTDSVIIYASGLLEEASALQSKLTAAYIPGIAVTSTDSASAKYRIVLGEVDCEATRIAKALYTEASAKSPGDHYWAFAYADGDLAVYAGDGLGYEQAISDLVSKNVNLGKLIIEKDFSATGVYTKAQHEDLLERIEKEKESVDIHLPHIDALLSLLEAQREELKTYMGKVSKYEANDPEILLFQ